MTIRTAFQIGGFQFNAFQEGLAFEIDGGRYPHGYRQRRPIFLPMRPEVEEEDRTPITATAHSTAAAACARATLRFTLSIAAVKMWSRPAYALAKISHDPFPITCLGMSKTTAAHSRTTVGLGLHATALAKGKASTMRGAAKHDPALQDFADFAERLSDLQLEPNATAEVDYDPELQDFVDLAQSLADLEVIE